AAVGQAAPGQYRKVIILVHKAAERGIRPVGQELQIGFLPLIKDQPGQGGSLLLEKAGSFFIHPPVYQFFRKKPEHLFSPFQSDTGFFNLCPGTGKKHNKKRRGSAPLLYRCTAYPGTTLRSGPAPSTAGVAREGF